MYCSKCGKQVDTSTRFCPDCGNDLSAVTNAGKTTPLAAQPPQENETDLVREGLKDEYELEKELGRGGMAVVYKARDKQLDREVAVKVLPFSLSFDAEFVERFQREARTAGKLEHPNIIPIYRVGRSGRVIYFVMKYIRGKSLSAVIEARGAMAVPDIKRFLVEATRALGYAHKHGIVHRDIKPDNIMFDELGQAIVADFGIAKAQSGAKLTGTGMSIGTPHYMSPEQARAQNLDGRSDIYSLGVVAYQALTGHVPFDGEDSFSIGYKHIMEELPVPTLEGADQREMFLVIQRMMAKKPDERFQSAEELIAAIEGVQVGAGADMATMRTLAMEPMKSPARPGGPPPMTSAPTTPLPRASASMGKPKEAEPVETKASPAKPSFKPKEITPKKSYAVPIGVAAALVLVGGGLGGYVLMNRKSDAPVTPQVAVNTPPVVVPQAGDSLSRSDASKAAAPDTAKAVTPAPAPVTTPAKRPAATSRTPAATSRTPTTTPPATTPRVTPPATTPTTTGATGTISLGGNIPAGARVLVDGQLRTGLRFKVPVGPHTLEITAQGYQPYSNRITVAPNATLPVAVTMATAAGPTTTATTPSTTTAPATPGAVPAACATANGNRANARKACWDSPPIPNTPTVLQAPPSCTGTVSRVNLLVQVSPQGEVVGTPTVTGASNCPAFNAQAVAQIQEITFIPAKKAGVPVTAWRIIPMNPSRQ